MSWEEKVKIQITKVAQNIKNGKRADTFRESAMFRLQAIVPACLVPLHSFLNNIFLMKSPKQILDSIHTIRDATKLFPLSGSKIAEDVNDFLNFCELDLYKVFLDEKTHDNLRDRHLVPLGAELGVININGVSKIDVMPGAENPHAKFTKAYLELLKEAINKAPETLNEPIGINWTRGEKRRSVKSWYIVGECMWNIYLLLLPLYLTHSRQETLARSRKYAVYPEAILRIIVEILQDIPHLEGLTPENAKDRIKYRIDKLGYPSDKDLLKMSASFFEKFGGGYDEAILTPYIKHTDKPLKKIPKPLQKINLNLEDIDKRIKKLMGL